MSRILPKIVLHTGEPTQKSEPFYKFNLYYKAGKYLYEPIRHTTCDVYTYEEAVKLVETILISELKRLSNVALPELRIIYKNFPTLVPLDSSETYISYYTLYYFINGVEHHVEVEEVED